MASSSKLFGANIEPACIVCRFGRPAPDKVMILCRKYGPVSPYYKCRKFEYDPLKRIPRRTPSLPTFDPEDFQL